MRKFSILFLMLSCITGLFAQPCSDLFISEYVEGSGNNKALEIYNPTASAINLSGYKLVQYNNGGDTVRYTFALSGTIAAYDVYVAASSQASATIKSFADTVTTNQLFGFNGNDVIALLKGTDTLDRLGRIGVATNFLFGADTAVDHTFVRLPNVQEGTANWVVGTTQWLSLAKDTIRLGTHTNTCANFVDTLVSFSQNAGSTAEDAGTFSIPLQINAPSAASTFGVSVVLVGGTGTAADINNYTTQTVTFAPQVGIQSLNLTITDDAIQEGPETFIFKLRSATGGVLIGADSTFTLTIGASDIPALALTIAQVTSVDTAFRPDSLGVPVILTGTVYGINNRASGVEFFIHDATGGIQVFNPSSSFNYTVAEGDSVLVEGQIGFFNGVTQVNFLDTILNLGTGIVPTPTVVQDLDESTEGELVRLNNVHLVTPGQWNLGSATGFNADITDGQTTWTLRIDEQTDIFTTSMAAPTGNFDVMGIGSQFDGSAPYNSGYQILPRYKTDIIQEVGINEVDNSLISVYPNPNSGSFIVALNEPGTETEVRVMSLTGAVVYLVKSADMNVTVNTTGLSAGLYIVEATTANKVSRSKVQINK